MNDNDRDYGLEKGFSPMAEKVILVDYDGTLFPWGELYSQAPPLPGAIEAMRRLNEAGFTLRVYSSRLAHSWLRAAGEDYFDQIEHMDTMLLRYGIPYDGFASQKEPAQFYVDDRAIEFKNNWDEVVERIFSEHEGA